MSQTSLSPASSHVSPRRLPLWAIGALLAVSSITVPSFIGSAAFAAEPGEDDPEVIEQAKQHYKAGLDAYKAGKFDVAIRELKKAYLLKRLPPLLLNIGATYRKMNDLDLSLHFYQKYLDEAPAGAKDRADVEKIIGELKAQKSAPVAEEPTRSEDAPPPAKEAKRGGEWNHNVIDAVPPETPIDVRVSTSVMKGVKVFVYYRGSGQADYQSVLMKRRGREKVGRIPAEAVNGRSLQYYIEAKDTAGTVVKSSGSSSNPNIIMVEEGVKPVMLASVSNRREDEQAEEEEEQPKRKNKPSRNLDDESAPTNGAVNLTDDEPVRPRKKKTGDLTLLQKAGIGALAGGGVLVIGGGAMLGIAKNDADVLTSNSKLGTPAAPIYFNNDPSLSGTQDSARASQGKALSAAGGVFVGIGAVGMAAGIGCLVADAIIKADKAHPKKKHKKRRRVDEEEEEETSNWYVAPSVGPTNAGVSGGFSF